MCPGSMGTHEIWPIAERHSGELQLQQCKHWRSMDRADRMTASTPGSQDVLLELGQLQCRSEGPMGCLDAGSVYIAMPRDRLGWQQ